MYCSEIIFLASFTDIFITKMYENQSIEFTVEANTKTRIENRFIRAIKIRSETEINQFFFYEQMKIDL